MAKAANASNYSGKTIVLMGLGKSTLALARVLHARGAKLRISEVKTKDHFVEAEKPRDMRGKPNRTHRKTRETVEDIEDARIIERAKRRRLLIVSEQSCQSCLVRKIES